jgi:3',5'-cyclic AMP phosphodiesterase CpdA
VRRIVSFAVVSALFVACSSSDDTSPSAPKADKPLPKPLPALTSVKLTTEATLSPKHAVGDGSLNPQKVDQLQSLLEQGYGEVDTIAGEPVVAHTFDGSPAPMPGANAKLVTRFVHLADTQLADDESPARLCSFDTPAATAGAFRPQEGHECRVLNAAVRTINALHEKLPLSFVVLGGDNSDNAQSNEVDWFQAILDGSPSVECDSGNDDDPVPGPDNDPKDAFVAEGLKVPWRWVTGNHDVLKQGNIGVKNAKPEAVGTVASGGTRDWSEPGAPVRKGEFVVADDRRALLERTELLKKVAGDGDGHGLDANVVAYGKAYYSFDVENTPLRVVVMDTAAETGGAEGVLHKADVDAFLKPALDDAKAKSKWVILTSHHISTSLSDGGDFGGQTQSDALTTEEFQSFVGGYPNVLMHLAGHTHVHRVHKVEPPGGHAYWELQTAALADFPHEMRMIEVWDQDDGFVSIRGIALDYSAEGDPIASDGRTRGVADFTSGWSPDGRGAAGDRNVELWIPKP